MYFNSECEETGIYSADLINFLSSLNSDHSSYWYQSRHCSSTNAELHQSSFVHRKLEPQQLYRQDNKINVMSIFPFDNNLGFEMFSIELLPGYTHLSSPHQKGVTEHVIPIVGSIEVLVHGQWHLVRQHEGLRFEASLSHGYRNLSGQSVLFHDIIHYTK